MRALICFSRMGSHPACVIALGLLFALNAANVCAEPIDKVLTDLDKQLDRIQSMVKDPKEIGSPSEALESAIDLHAEIAKKGFEIAIQSAKVFVGSKGKEGNVEDLGKFEAVITKHRAAADAVMRVLGDASQDDKKTQSGEGSLVQRLAKACVEEASMLSRRGAQSLLDLLIPKAEAAYGYICYSSCRSKNYGSCAACIGGAPDLVDSAWSTFKGCRSWCKRHVTTFLGARKVCRASCWVVFLGALA